MVKVNFRGFLGLSFALAAWACTSQPAASQGALTADPAARSFGIASYVVEGDNVRMLDSYGIELGTFSVRDGAESRIIDVSLADGSSIEPLEVYRPMADGRFLAPMTRDTVLGAALADQALAPMLAAHDIKFVANASEPATAALAPSDIANTTSCDTPSADTPLGCARPANTSVGCTNVSQLPPTITSSAHVQWNSPGPIMTSNLGYCQSQVASWCATTYGGTQSAWMANGNVYCGNLQGTYFTTTYCYPLQSANKWVASCPPSTCTAPNYDAVPRLRSCTDPGSCTKSQGTVTCTTYH